MSFSYFFLAMCSFYVLKPVREALFLNTQGYQAFALVHLLVGVASYAAVRLYDRLARHRSGAKLVGASNLISACCILAFWQTWRSATENGHLQQVLPWLFYIGVSLYGVFVVALFWSLTHDIFSPVEGQRWYGWIGTGGILGAVFGGRLTYLLTPHLGTDNLVAVAALTLLPCIVIAQAMGHFSIEPSALSSKLETNLEGGSPWGLIARSAYLTQIAALVCVTMVVAELGDLQTHRVLTLVCKSRDEITSFYSRMFFYANLTGLVVNLALTRPVQSRFGPWVGLLLLQAVASAKAVGISLYPDLGLLTLSLSSDYAVHYSIFQSSKELLYTPTSRKVKFRAKAIIDTFVFRLGVSFGAVVVLLVQNEASLGFIAMLILILSVSASFLGLVLDGRYKALIRETQVS